MWHLAPGGNGERGTQAAGRGAQFAWAGLLGLVSTGVSQLLPLVMDSVCSAMGCSLARLGGSSWHWGGQKTCGCSGGWG